MSLQWEYGGKNRMLFRDKLRKNTQFVRADADIHMVKSEEILITYHVNQWDIYNSIKDTYIKWYKISKQNIKIK